jgi:hypothetical protein
LNPSRKESRPCKARRFTHFASYRFAAKLQQTANSPIAYGASPDREANDRPQDRSDQFADKTPSGWAKIAGSSSADPVCPFEKNLGSVPTLIPICLWNFSIPSCRSRRSYRHQFNPETRKVRF